MGENADGREPPGPVANDHAAASGSMVASTKSELSFYSDTNAVTVITPAVSGAVSDPAGGWSASGSYLADVVSAASVDIVSTATPRWQEVRHAGALTGTYRSGSVGGTLVGSSSREPDYVSLSAGGALDLELVDKTVNPRIAYSYAHDTAGRTGTPFSVYSLELVRHAIGASVEVVVDRSTAVVLGADAVFETGNQEKPYRFLPLFAPDVVASIHAGAPGDLVNQLRLPGRVSEQLPEARTRVALFGRLSRRFSGATLIASERLYTDDWGLKASTTEVQLMADAGRRLVVWATLRGHFQSAVSFWQRAYVATSSPESPLSVPRWRTGDREMSPLQSLTFGPGARWYLGSSTHRGAWSFVAQADVMTTRFSDALFIRSRNAYLGIIQLEGEL